jgi:EAL domain-containing protein (putative c-di-GMP-specific phosphodiesterase class I)
MKITESNKYTPVFTPRFHLADASLVGFEVKIKQGQKMLPAHEAFMLVQSGHGLGLLKKINSYLLNWCEKTGGPLYLSWELSSKTVPGDMPLFLHELSLALPPQQLEMVLDASGLTAEDALDKCQQLFVQLPDRGIRRGVFHSRPRSFDIDVFCRHIDIFKINKGMITEIKDTVLTARESYCFIDRLNKEKIAIVAVDLYCKEDVASMILMGIGYGQGYFLSRNSVPQEHVSVKPVKKNQGPDFYPRYLENFGS